MSKVHDSKIVLLKHCCPALSSSIRHVNVSRLHNARPFQVELANTDQSSYVVLLTLYLHAYLIPLLLEVRRVAL